MASRSPLHSVADSSEVAERLVTPSRPCKRPECANRVRDDGRPGRKAVFCSGTCRQLFASERHRAEVVLREAREQAALYGLDVHTAGRDRGEEESPKATAFSFIMGRITELLDLYDEGLVKPRESVKILSAMQKEALRLTRQLP